MRRLRPHHRIYSLRGSTFLNIQSVQITKHLEILIARRTSGCLLRHSRRRIHSLIVHLESVREIIHYVHHLTQFMVNVLHVTLKFVVLLAII